MKFGQIGKVKEGIQLGFTSENDPEKVYSSNGFTFFKHPVYMVNPSNGKIKKVIAYKTSTKECYLDSGDGLGDKDGVLPSGPLGKSTDLVEFFNPNSLDKTSKFPTKEKIKSVIEFVHKNVKNSKDQDTIDDYNAFLEACEIFIIESLKSEKPENVSSYIDKFRVPNIYNVSIFDAISETSSQNDNTSFPVKVEIPAKLENKKDTAEKTKSVTSETFDSPNLVVATLPVATKTTKVNKEANKEVDSTVNQIKGGPVEVLNELDYSKSYIDESYFDTSEPISENYGEVTGNNDLNGYLDYLAGAPIPDEAPILDESSDSDEININEMEVSTVNGDSSSFQESSEKRVIRNEGEDFVQAKREIFNVSDFVVERMAKQICTYLEGKRASDKNLPEFTYDINNIEYTVLKNSKGYVSSYFKFPYTKEKNIVCAGKFTETNIWTNKVEDDGLFLKTHKGNTGKLVWEKLKVVTNKNK